MTTSEPAPPAHLAPIGPERVCAICGTPEFPRPPHDGGTPCIRADCRQVVEMKATMHPAAYREYFRQRSDFIRKGIEREKARWAAEELERRKLDAEDQAYWKRQSAEQPQFAPEQYPLTVIPSCRRKLVNLPERRRHQFRDNLTESLSRASLALLRIAASPSADPAAAAAQAPQPTPPDAGLDTLIGKACTLCAGGCCTRGDNHAYLGTETLSRVMREQPTLRPRHLLSMYMAHLENVTYAESCVFHGAAGCALPRALRSDTCNTFLCTGLSELSVRFSKQPLPAGTFVIVRSQEVWDVRGEENNSIEQSRVLTCDAAEPG